MLENCSSIWVWLWLWYTMHAHFAYFSLVSNKTITNFIFKTAFTNKQREKCAWMNYTIKKKNEIKYEENISHKTPLIEVCVCAYLCVTRMYSIHSFIRSYAKYGLVLELRNKISVYTFCAWNWQLWWNASCVRCCCLCRMDGGNASKIAQTENWMVHVQKV